MLRPLRVQKHATQIKIPPWQETFEILPIIINVVTPAKAGVHKIQRHKWIPACAGMTGGDENDSAVNTSKNSWQGGQDGYFFEIAVESPLLRGNKRGIISRI